MKQKSTSKNFRQAARIPKKSEKSSVSLSNRTLYFIQIIIIILLGSIIYSNSFGCSFHFDDLTSFVNNKAVRAIGVGNFSELWKFAGLRSVSVYSFILNLHFNQLDVWGYHFLNLIIHLSNALLVFWMTHLIFSAPAIKSLTISKHKQNIAFFTGLLFVAHPLATSSVTYIVQRISIIVALFYFLSICLYLKARLTNTNSHKIIFYTLSFLSAVFAFLSKQNAFTLPITILLFEFALFSENGIKLDVKNQKFLIFFLFILLILAIIPFVYFFHDIFRSIPPVADLTEKITPVIYLLTQFGVIIKYIQLLVFPYSQNLDYDFPLSHSLFEPTTLICFILILALISAAIWLFKRNRLISFGIFWFFITLSIESGILPIKDVIFEHRTYLPSFGYFLILSVLVFSFIPENNRKWVFLILGLWIVILSFMSYQRNKIWKDDITLYTDNVMKSPNKARPLTNRGWAYARTGDYPKAIDDYTKSISLCPSFATTYYNRGVAFLKLDQYQNALNDFTATVKYDPSYIEAYYNKGIANLKLKKWPESITDFNITLKLSPKYLGAHFNLGLAFSKLQQWDQAIKSYNKVLKLDSLYTDAYFNRGIAYSMLEKNNMAIRDFTKTISLNPSYPRVYYNRSFIYLKTKRNWLAIKDLTSEIQNNPNDVEAYYNRAMAYGFNNHWKKAILDYKKVLELYPDHPKAGKNLVIAYQELEKKKK